MIKRVAYQTRRRQQQYIKPSITFSYNNLLTILFITTSTLLTHPIVINAQQEEEIISNPLNQYCGPTYSEAKQYCYLTNPSKSLPCPNGKYYEFYQGGDDKCPYDMNCWTIKETCVDPNAIADEYGESNINLQQPAAAVDEEFDAHGRQSSGQPRGKPS